MSQLFTWGGQSTGVSALPSSFQRNPRADLLQNGLVGSPCSQRDSQESSPTPQFKSMNSSALSFLCFQLPTEKEWIYVYVLLSHFAVHLKLTIKLLNKIKKNSCNGIMKCCSPIQVLIHPVLIKAPQWIISLSGFCVTFQSFYADINTHTHIRTHRVPSGNCEEESVHASL